MLRTTLLLILFAYILQCQVECAKILAVFPFAGRSQFICGEQYLKTLAARGHEVTVVSGYPQKQPIKNYRDIPVMEVHKGYEDIINRFLNTTALFDGLNLGSETYIKFQKLALENPGMQKLMRTEKFDLVIMEQLECELLAGLGPHFNAPMIAVSTLSTMPSTDDLVGNTSPLSYIIEPLTGLEEMNSIWARFENLKFHIISKLYHNYVHLKRQRKLFKKYFPHIKTDIAEVRKNFSLVLVNDNYVFSGARPYVPNMIEVGGFFITPKRIPLPKHMEKFINESQHGVIYFSMGTNVKSSNFPVQLRDTILKTFAALPERVLWKFEEPDLPGKPDNVFISPWFPQTDILAHPNVKLFITHCGKLSSLEALYHGKPIIGFPAFYDQFSNSYVLKQRNMGLVDSLDGLTVEKFTRLLRTVIDDPQYRESTQKLSAIYHDEPMTALEKAIYWTEYVIRHNGAPHMRVNGQKLSFMEYFNIDILLIALIILIITILITVNLIKILKRLLNTGAINKRHKTAKKRN